MKCSNCGRDIQIGEGFCHFCGKEIRIVPDYNILEDELHVLIDESKNKENNSNSTKNNKKKMEINTDISDIEKNNSIHNQSQKPEKNYKKLIIILCSVVAIVFLLIIIYAFISTSKKEKSFVFQYDKAVEYMNEGLYGKAKNCLEQALEIDSDNQKAMLKMAELYILEDKKGKAINEYLDIIALYPNEKMAYEKLLFIYEKDNDREAILDLVASVKSNNKVILTLFKNYIVAKPEFEVKPGVFDKETELTISAAINVQIFYTIDGTTPTENSDLYTGKILLTEGTIIVRAIAINDYDVSSKIIEGKYEINLTAPEAPTASIGSGTYNVDQLITVLMSEGSMVYYTWDGTNPNANSLNYVEPIKMLPGNNVLSLIAIDRHKKSSEVIRYNYILNVVEN